MEKVIENKVEFDVAKALVIIQKNEDLSDMFTAEVKTDYKVLQATLGQGAKLPKKIETLIKGIFDGVIAENGKVAKRYEKLYNSLKTLEVKEVKEVTEKPTNAKKRWGLRDITSDVTNYFGGKAKQIHKLGVKVQTLKKTFSKLELLTYNERFEDGKLTDKQLREIGGIIDTCNKAIEKELKDL